MSLSVQTDVDETLAVGRSNLLLISRLVIRGLLENCMQLKCRMLHAEHRQLRDFFIIVERVLRHGLRSSRSLINLRSSDQELWTFIGRCSKSQADANETVLCVEQLPNVHSYLCRIRSWLRLALMQKKLSDYFSILIESKAILKEYYEDWALLRHDTDAVIFSGSLVGLRVVDCNLYLKELDLSSQPVEIDLNLYVKSPTIPVEEVVESDADFASRPAESDQPDMKNILDQKNYLEERNRALSSVTENMKKRLALLEVMRRHRNVGQEVQEDRGIPIDELQSMDICPLDRVEEMETVMALLEKSVHEKQDTIVSLRQQIDDIKKINLDLYQKLRAADDVVKNKEKSFAKSQAEFEADKAHYQSKISQLETYIKDAEGRFKKSEDFVATLQFEINQKSEFSAQIQSQLVELQQSNQLLQRSLDAERLVRDELDAQIQNSKSTERDISDIKAENILLVHKVAEYERTMEELGISLSESKLKMEDLREGLSPLTEAQWESDKENQECNQCHLKFSVSRRKHHCRNCGGIFCNSCSGNTLPLPSSAKPVRVCDGCYTLILQRFSTKNMTSVENT